MNKNAEILAPAGSIDSLVAAVRCGANAVYLGSDSFNARRNAQNFSGDSLKQAIEYCHIRGVKVYITLNTLVADSEFPDALSLIECGCAYGADAFIIQDLGIAKAVRTLAPSMPMHASTQMAVSTPAGFEVLESFGFKRAVLPRELSLSEIKVIRNNTSMELEMFIHGALCMSVSGQCYLSAMLGGRSGNRGLCAQPCRLPFVAKGGTGYDLSLKDLSLIEHISELSDLGIDSFKIEGRMKRPEYVAAAVTACKNAQSGKKDEKISENLRAVFSRSGFTDGYYAEKRGKGMFGTRGKEDVTAANDALSSLKKLYEAENGAIPISMGLKAEIGKPLMASASTGKVIAFTTSSYKVEKAQNHATEVSTIRTQLKKCGGTPFEVKMTDIDIDAEINIPLSEINRIRRSVLDILEHKLCEGHEKPCADVEDFLKPAVVIHDATCKSHIKSLTENSTAQKGCTAPLHTPQRIARFSDASQIPSDIEEYAISKIIIPLGTPEDKLSKIKKLSIPFGYEIPRALYNYTGHSKIGKLIKDAAKDYAKSTAKSTASSTASFLYAPTLDGVALAKRYDTNAVLKIMGGFTLNAYNSHTLSELKSLGLSSCTVSFEMTLDDIKNLKVDTSDTSKFSIGACVYGRLPLMLTRNCPLRNGTDCKTCGGNGFLTDRMGIRFPISCTRKEDGSSGASELLNSRPLYLADKQALFSPPHTSLSFLLLYFTKETPEKVSAVLSDYATSRNAEGEFTRGLYFRGVE